MCVWVGVIRAGATGIVKFIGETQFATGIWVGVQLPGPTGKHNGTVDGHSYFACKRGHGIFVKLDKVQKADE